MTGVRAIEAVAAHARFGTATSWRSASGIRKAATHSGRSKARTLPAFRSALACERYRRVSTSALNRELASIVLKKRFAPLAKASGVL